MMPYLRPTTPHCICIPSMHLGAVKGPYLTLLAYSSPLHQVTLITINTALPEVQQAQLTAAVIELVTSQQSQLAGTPQQSEGCLFVLASTLLQRSKLKGTM